MVQFIHGVLPLSWGALLLMPWIHVSVDQSIPQPETLLEVSVMVPGPTSRRAVQYHATLDFQSPLIFRRHGNNIGEDPNITRESNWSNMLAASAYVGH